MTAFEWPGNVRQLRNVVERAAILCEGDQVTRRDLPLFSETEDAGRPDESIPATNEELKVMKKQIRQQAVGRVEKKFIENALERNEWNVTRAAQETGMQRTNFQNLMKKHGILLSGREQPESDE